MAQETRSPRDNVSPGQPTIPGAEQPTPEATTSTLQQTPPPAVPAPQNWDTLIGVLALLVSVATFAFGLKKPDLSAFWKTLLYVLEIVALLASVFLLGWLGFWLLAASLLITFLVHSLRLFMKLESVLTSAAIEGGREHSEMKGLYDSLRGSHIALKWLGPIETANLIRYLAQRGREPEEIREMAIPIAMLLATFQPGTMESLVERFDRLLRLAGKASSDAMSVADTLTAGTQKGAASFNEMLDAMIVFYSP